MKRKSQRGAAQAPLIIGLLLLGLALPAALQLVQQRQETRKSATADCGGLTGTHCNTTDCHDYYCNDGTWEDQGYCGPKCSAHPDCSSQCGDGGGDDSGGTDCSDVYNKDLSGYSCQDGVLLDASGNRADKQKWCGTDCPSTVESNSDCCDGQDICQCSGGDDDGGGGGGGDEGGGDSWFECYCYDGDRNCVYKTFQATDYSSCNDACEVCDPNTVEDCRLEQTPAGSQCVGTCLAGKECKAVSGECVCVGDADLKWKCTALDYCVQSYDGTYDSEIECNLECVEPSYEPTATPTPEGCPLESCAGESLTATRCVGDQFQECNWYLLSMGGRCTGKYWVDSQGDCSLTPTPTPDTSCPLEPCAGESLTATRCVGDQFQECNWYLLSMGGRCTGKYWVDSQGDCEDEKGSQYTCEGDCHEHTCTSLGRTTEFGTCPDTDPFCCGLPVNNTCEGSCHEHTCTSLGRISADGDCPDNEPFCCGAPLNYTCEGTCFEHTCTSLGRTFADGDCPDNEPFCCGAPLNYTCEETCFEHTCTSLGRTFADGNCPDNTPFCCGASSQATPIPTVPPGEPTQPPVEPTSPPGEPTVPPGEPTQPPGEPTVPPEEPTQPPVETGCKPCPDGSFADRGTTSYNCQTSGATLTDFLGWKEQYIKIFFRAEQIPAGQLYADYNCDGNVGIDDFLLWKEKYIDYLRN